MELGKWSDSQNDFNNGKFLELVSDHTGHVTKGVGFFTRSDVEWKLLDDGTIEITQVTGFNKGRKHMFKYVKKYDALVKINAEGEFGRERRLLRVGK